MDCPVPLTERHSNDNVDKMTDKKLPGSAEPLLGKCGSKMHKWDDPEDDRFGRYCTRPAGAGTPHVGEGCCKMHLGNTPRHLIKHERNAVIAEVRTLAERLGEPEPIGDPIVELYRLTGKIKQWEEIATEKMSELEDLTSFDRQGVERARAMLEVWERAVDRAASTYISLTKLGIMQHKAELEEQHAKLLYNIVTTVIESAEVGLTDDQVTKAKTILVGEIIKAGSRLTPDWFPDDFGDDEDVVDADLI